jgi:hypothetical protein
MLAAAASDPADVLRVDLKTAPDNVVSRLAAKLRTGDSKLTYDPDHGYLPSLLEQLRIPVSSQVLVFSKTSFQASKISPKTPRALYHSDESYIGWVRGGDVIEIAAFDPGLGIAFYTLDQEQVRKPVIEQRGQECLQCHHHSSTLGVPGLVVRSIIPDRSGMPVFPSPSYITDHRSPIDKRWGGWYVSGTHGKMQHMGNSAIEKGASASSFDLMAGSNVKTLDSYFTTTPYLSPHSDIASLMVLEHRIRVTNILNRLRFEEQSGKLSEATHDSAVQALRMDDEAPLTARIEGMSSFREDYKVDLDLKTRLFKQKRSPLVDSPMFRTLPVSLQEKIRIRLR